MNIEEIEAVWIDERGAISLTTLQSLSGLSEADLRALVDCGALNPADPAAAELNFERRCVAAVKVAGRLRRDFDLDPDALALALGLVERIQELEGELRKLRVLMPHRSS